MSTRFGEIRQIAFVVKDLARALDYWTKTLGVGPFFLMRDLVPENYRYRGEPSPPPRITLALANSGGLQVEVIEQHDDRPSAYRDYLQAGHEGFQHVSSWLTRADYDATRERVLASGITVAHEGSIPGNGIRFVYFATDAVPGGFLYEMADVLEPATYPLVKAIADAAVGWDGREPVRELRA